MERILIVGGAGYIGGAVTDVLKEKKVEQVVYDNLMFERDYRKKVQFVYGDVRDTKSLKKLIDDEQPSAIIWLAAIVGDGACQVNPELTLNVNQESVRWLADNYDGRIIYTSTCSVYGKNDKELDENSPTNPLSLYAQTKLECEKILKGKNAVIFRLGTLYGISDEFSRIRLDLVVNILALKSALGKDLTVFGGEQWRPLLHVRDAALAIADAAINKGLPAGIYNLGSENLMIKEIAEGIKKVNPTVKIVYSDLSFEDARNYKVSARKYTSNPHAVPLKKNVMLGAMDIIDLINSGRIKNPLEAIYHNANFMKGEVPEWLTRK